MTVSLPYIFLFNTEKFVVLNNNFFLKKKEEQKKCLLFIGNACFCTDIHCAQNVLFTRPGVVSAGLSVDSPGV